MGLEDFALGINPALQYMTNRENVGMQRETNAMNAEEAERNRIFQVREAWTARDYEKGLADTAVQRRAKDMQAAGINPLLAAGAAADSPGTSAPAGGAANFTAPQIHSPDLMIGGLISLAQLDQAQQRLEIDKSKAAVDMANTSSKTKLQDAEAVLKNKGKIRAELEGTISEKIRDLINYFQTKSPRKAPSLRNVPDQQPSPSGVRRGMD